jgi:hypothetical protein
MALLKINEQNIRPTKFTNWQTRQSNIALLFLPVCVRSDFY